MCRSHADSLTARLRAILVELGEPILTRELIARFPAGCRPSLGQINDALVYLRRRGEAVCAGRAQRARWRASSPADKPDMSAAWRTLAAWRPAVPTNDEGEAA